MLPPVCSYPSGVNKQWIVSDTHTLPSTYSKRLDSVEELSFIILLCNSRGELTDQALAPGSRGLFFFFFFVMSKSSIQIAVFLDSQRDPLEPVGH